MEAYKGNKNQDFYAIASDVNVDDYGMHGIHFIDRGYKFGYRNLR